MRNDYEMDFDRNEGYRFWVRTLDQRSHQRATAIQIKNRVAKSINELLEVLVGIDKKCRLFSLLLKPIIVQLLTTYLFGSKVSQILNYGLQPSPKFF